MNLDHDFFQVSKLSEDQQTAPNIIQRSDADQSQIIGGNAVKLLGEIYPPIPPGFGIPGRTVRTCAGIKFFLKNIAVG